VIVNDSALVPPAPIDVGVNWLLIVGGSVAAPAADGRAASVPVAMRTAAKPHRRRRRAIVAPELNILASVLNCVPFNESDSRSAHPAEPRTNKLHNLD
jgi:hypothetical protein